MPIKSTAIFVAIKGHIRYDSGGAHGFFNGTLGRNVFCRPTSERHPFSELVIKPLLSRWVASVPRLHDAIGRAGFISREPVAWNGLVCDINGAEDPSFELSLLKILRFSRETRLFADSAGFSSKHWR
jgi:hypothetical protein